LRLSERRATNIGLLYPKVRNNIGGIFPLTSPNQNIGDVSPASPAGLTPVRASNTELAHYRQHALLTPPPSREENGRDGKEEVRESWWKGEGGF